MPVSDGISLTMLLLVPAQLRTTGRKVPNVVPSKDAAHMRPSAQPVYTVPDNMNAPRTWLQDRPVVGTGVAAPPVVPSNECPETVSLLDWDAKPVPHMLTTSTADTIGSLTPACAKLTSRLP